MTALVKHTGRELSPRERTDLGTTLNFEEYRGFRGLHFRVISDLPPGETVEITTEEPTYIQQSTGDIIVTARAPTVIYGCTGNIILDAYAPMLIKGSTGHLTAHLRDNTAIVGTTGDLNITAARYLQLIGQRIPKVNGRWNGWGNVHRHAPESNDRVILLKGSTGNLNFQYEFERERISGDYGTERLTRDVMGLLE